MGFGRLSERIGIRVHIRQHGFFPPEAALSDGHGEGRSSGRSRHQEPVRDPGPAFRTFE